MNQKNEVRFDESGIDALCRDFDQCHLPGAVVGIAVDGRPVYRKGFGLANMDLPVTLTPSTRLRICSVTKQFTALVCLLLCEERLANVDDRIEQHLPEIHRANHGVTLRQLMGNISGLRDAHGICWQMSGLEAKASSEELLSQYRKLDDVNFPPGTACCYNNGGFLLLSAVIERLTDQSLEEVLRQRIFEPLGMNDSQLQRSDAPFVSRCGASHMKGKNGGFYRYLVGSEAAGEGGVISTVDDMLRWLANMRLARVGSPQSWELMRSAQKLSNGTFTGYGMGLSVGHYRGVETLSHPGGWMGTNAQLIQVPSAGLDIIVIANRHDVASSLLAYGILDRCLPELEPARSAEARPIARGVFRAPKTGRILELGSREDQQVVCIDGMEVILQARDDGVFVPTGLMSFLRQSFTPVGDPSTPMAVRFNDFGNVEVCEPVPPGDGVGQPPRGRYSSSSTESELDIVTTGDTLEVRSSGRFGSVSYHGKRLAERAWQLIPASDAAQWGGTVSFSPGYEALRLSSWSNWALPFRRIS